MSERPSRHVSEVPATVGLLLNFAAVMAFALSLAAFGLGETAIAASMVSAATIGFAASLMCFAIDGRRRDEPVPE